MIPLYCIVDLEQIPEERVRRGAKTCNKERQKVFRRAARSAIVRPRRTTTLDKINQRAKEQCS